jgi:hypothetical protein
LVNKADFYTTELQSSKIRVPELPIYSSVIKKRDLDLLNIDARWLRTFMTEKLTWLPIIFK